MKLDEYYVWLESLADRFSKLVCSANNCNEEKRNVSVKNTFKIVNLQGFNLSPSKLHYPKDFNFVKHLLYKRVTVLTKNLEKLARISDKSMLKHLM